MRAEEGNSPAGGAPEEGAEPAPVDEEPEGAELGPLDESSAPEAVIFVPAIGPWTDQDLGTIALRIMLALEEQASEEQVFSVTAAAHLSALSGRRPFPEGRAAGAWVFKG